MGASDALTRTLHLSPWDIRRWPLGPSCVWSSMAAGVPGRTVPGSPAQAQLRSGPPTQLRRPRLRDPAARRLGAGAAGASPRPRREGPPGAERAAAAGGRQAGGGGGSRRRAGRGPSPLPPRAPPPATLPLLGRGRRRRRQEGRRRRRRRRDLEFPSAAAAAAAAAAPRLQARPPPEAPVARGGRGGSASRRPGFWKLPGRDARSRRRKPSGTEVSWARGARAPTPPPPSLAAPPTCVRLRPAPPKSLQRAPRQADARAPGRPTQCARPCTSRVDGHAHPLTHARAQTVHRGPRALQCTPRQPLSHHRLLSPTQASTHPRRCHASVHTQARVSVRARSHHTHTHTHTHIRTHTHRYPTHPWDFQTWPRGWFHIPQDPDFPVPS